MAKNRKRPTYQLHQKSGQARTYIDGTDYYLGPHGSPESYQQFDDLVAKWLATGQVGSYRARVDDLAILFCEHADAYYRKTTGKPTGEAGNIRQALRPLTAKFGTTLARDFSPKRFKEYRDKLIADGICRTSINRHAARVRGMFRWAAENDHIPVTVWQSLTAVKALAAGRTTAIETDPIKPVPQEHVDAVEPFLSRQLWACVRLQLLTGARPGEILSMRGADLTTSGPVWEYRPQSHKTDRRKSRTIFLGPVAQGIVSEFLKTDLQGFLFSPKDARAEWLSQFTGPGRPKKKGTMTRQAGERYTAASYAAAIGRACEKAEVPHWHPHQLRHSSGTSLRREFGLDAARAILGHSSVTATQIYAEADEGKAREIIGRIG